MRYERKAADIPFMGLAKTKQLELHPRGRMKPTIDRAVGGE
jgi:hypothetical protein